MLWEVDPTATVPLYEQLATCVRRELGAGRLARGDRLPAARQVATALDVNLHTVLRAYQLLRDEQLIDLRRGRGAVVVADPTAGRTRLHDLVTELVTEARRAGVEPSEVHTLIDKELRA